MFASFNSVELSALTSIHSPLNHVFSLIYIDWIYFYKDFSLILSYYKAISRPAIQIEIYKVLHYLTTKKLGLFVYRGHIERKVWTFYASPLLLFLARGMIYILRLHCWTDFQIQTKFNLTTNPYIKMTDNANVITAIIGTSLISVIRAGPPFFIYIS